jgi:hypothetical protein
MICIRYSIGSWDSAVSMATDCGLRGRVARVRVPVGAGFFFSPRRPYWFWGPPSLLSNGYQALFLGGGVGGKQLGHQADHSPPTSAKAKNMWIYTSTPHTSSMRNA